MNLAFLPMSHPNFLLRLARPSLVVAAVVALAPLARAQGALTPPGAPAPTMKTLTQVEPRTPLTAGAAGVTVNANGGFTLTAPGSYYLTGDLVVATDYGILINSDDVTLDLSGFSIRSAATGVIGAGILTSYGRDRITIRHGSIHGQGTVDLTTTPDTYTDLGFDTAISASTSEQVLVEDVHVGGTHHGIYLGLGSCIVRNCTASRISGNGIVASHVESCIARLIGGTAINAQVATACTGESQTGRGISATQASNCQGISYNGFAVYAQVVSDCRGFSTAGYGIVGTTVLNSVGESPNGYGISGKNVSNCTATSTQAIALIAETATHCSGTSTADSGIVATIASGCYGRTENGTYGLSATQANDCWGYNWYGLYGLSAVDAIHSVGTNIYGSYGLYSSGIAAYCRGSAGSGGVGLFTVSAIGCLNTSSLSATYRYLTP